MRILLRAAAADLLARHAPGFEAEWRGALDSADEVQVYDSQLDVEGDWRPNGFVIVNGNLNVGGQLRTFDVDTLIVLGNASSASAVFGGPVVITGDLHARAWVYANASNDYDLVVGGTLRAKLFVEEGMASCARMFHCVVWRTMNVVIQQEPRIEYPRLAHDDRTRARAARTSLSSEELEHLSEYAVLRE